MDLSNLTALCSQSSMKALEEIWHASLGHQQSKILRILHNNSLLNLHPWLNLQSVLVANKEKVRNCHFL